MASTINGTSTGSGGLISTGDDSGILNIQTNETTAITVDASQRVAFVAGTAALPSITNDGDTNTGIYFPAADTIAFSEGGAESMRIDSSGNVGIGTASPSAKLHVSGGQSYVTGASSAGAYSRWYNNAQTTGDFQVGQGWLSVSDNIGVLCNNANAAMILGTNAAERMRILSDGKVFVGTGTDFTDNPQQGLILYAANNNSQLVVSHGNGTSSGTYFAKFDYNANTIGTITQNGTTAVAYNTSSDYRLKENIAPLTGALNKVSQLKPVSYTWKASPEETGEGFIAHELAEVCPQAVHGAKDEVDADGNPQYQGIDTSFLVATLTAAIQELKAINDTQAETINALTARIVALEGQ